MTAAEDGTHKESVCGLIIELLKGTYIAVSVG